MEDLPIILSNPEAQNERRRFAFVMTLLTIDTVLVLSIVIVLLLRR